MKEEKEDQTREDAMGNSSDSPAAPANDVDPTFVDNAEPIAVLRAIAYCARHWEGGARLLGNVRACDIVRACEAFEALVKAGDATIVQADEENWRCYNGTDASRLLQLEFALDNVSPDIIDSDA